MSSGENHPTETVIVDPEGYEDIKKKYLDREKEMQKKLRERQGVATQDEALKKAQEAIRKRELRTEHQHLKDREIIIDEKNPEVKSLRTKLSIETDETAQKIFGQLKPEQKDSLERKVLGLKGRVKVPPPSSSEESAPPPPPKTD